MTQPLQPRVLSYGRPRRPPRRRTRVHRFLVLAVLVAGIFVLSVDPDVVGLGRSSNGAQLTPLQQRIVTAAESQVGYRTDPPDRIPIPTTTAIAPTGFLGLPIAATTTWTRSGAPTLPHGYGGKRESAFTIGSSAATSTPHRPASTSGAWPTGTGIRSGMAMCPNQET